MLSTTDYVAYMKNAALESMSTQSRPTATTSNTNLSDLPPTTQVEVPHVSAPELSVEDVAEYLEKVFILYSGVA